MKHGWLIGFGILLLLVGAVLVVMVLFGGSALRGVCPWCGQSAVDAPVTSPRGPMGGLPGNDTAQPGAYSSNGEQIFFSGVGHNGLIGRSVTFGPGMMGGTGCASCHGADGAGGQFVMMRRTYDAPDITYAALTAPHTSHEGDSEPAWTESDIRAAIRDGIEPSGDTLDPIMPRWNMDDQDMADLIGYLKELSAQ